VPIHEAAPVPARETEGVERDTLAAADRRRGEQPLERRKRRIMGYYDNDATETESSFADPSAELEIQAEGDEPGDDLGDGLRRRKDVVEIGDLDWQPARRRSARGF
jgi:hypothetical protein